MCVDDLNVTERPDGTFSSGFWKLGAEAALRAEFLALHPKRGEASTRQGTIVERHLVDCTEGKRYVFVVSPVAEPVEWEGTAGR